MDKIVAAVQQKDYVLVFTEQGLVYRVWEDWSTKQIFVQKEIAYIPLRG